MKTEKNPQRQSKKTKDIRRPRWICKYNKSNKTQDKPWSSKCAIPLKDVLIHKKKRAGRAGPQITRTQEDARRRHEPQEITTHTFTMTYCVIEEREIKQNKIRSAISISAVKPHRYAFLACLPAVTGFYCRNCYSADLLVWMATYWNTFFNLELLLCALKKAARTRVRLGKSHDKTNLKMLICKTKFGVASWLWAITRLIQTSR